MHGRALRLCEPQEISFAKACDRWRAQPSHSELNNVNERPRIFANRFRTLRTASGKRDRNRTRVQAMARIARTIACMNRTKQKSYGLFTLRDTRSRRQKSHLLPPGAEALSEKAPQAIFPMD